MSGVQPFFTGTQLKFSQMSVPDKEMVKLSYAGGAGKEQSVMLGG